MKKQIAIIGLALVVMIGVIAVVVLNNTEQKQSIPVLMYHHFDESESSTVTIHPDEFEEQMRYLQSEGYTALSNQALLDIINNEKEMPEKPIVITMDDGYESNYTYAYPIIKKYDMFATIYVIGSKMRETNDSEYPPEIPKLSWEQAKEMVDSGYMDIQSHTFDMHYKLPNESGKEIALITGPVNMDGILETEEEYEARVITDLTENKRLIEEKIGNDVIALAYPYGAFNDDSERLLKESDYLMSFTVKEDVNLVDDGAFLLNRINVPAGMTGKDIVKEIESYRH